MIQWEKRTRKQTHLKLHFRFFRIDINSAKKTLKETWPDSSNQHPSVHPFVAGVSGTSIFWEEVLSDRQARHAKRGALLHWADYKRPHWVETSMGSSHVLMALIFFGISPPEKQWVFQFPQILRAPELTYFLARRWFQHTMLESQKLRLRRLFLALRPISRPQDLFLSFDITGLEVDHKSTFKSTYNIYIYIYGYRSYMLIFYFFLKVFFLVFQQLHLMHPCCAMILRFYSWHVDTSIQSILFSPTNQSMLRDYWM